MVWSQEREKPVPHESDQHQHEINKKKNKTFYFFNGKKNTLEQNRNNLRFQFGLIRWPRKDHSMCIYGTKISYTLIAVKISIRNRFASAEFFCLCIHLLLRIFVYLLLWQSDETYRNEKKNKNKVLNIWADEAQTEKKRQQKLV